jgi:hypothetical protein
MRKTITKSLVPVISLLCLFILAACPPDAGNGTESSGEETEQVTITNIPATVGVGGKSTYKVYIQLSEGMTAKAGYVAKGEILISAGESSSGEKYEVTIPDLKDPSGNDWAGSDFSSVCVLIVPKAVNNINDTDAKAGLVKSSKTLVLDWDKLFQGKGGVIKDSDYAKLYQDIVVKDGDIEGAKAE